MVWRFFKEIGFLSATTIGAGVFALPYVFHRAGWFVGLLFLVALSLIVIFAQRLYFRVIEKTGGATKFLGLIREKLGVKFFTIGFISIILGLLLSLTAYLLIAQNFVKLIFPELDSSLAILIFWGLGTIPFLFRLGKLVLAELFGAVVMFFIIFYIFGMSLGSGGDIFSIPAVSGADFFLPFGVVLFSLAGWTAIEPIIDSRKKSAKAYPRGFSLSVSLGTILSAIFYILFVVAIFGLATGSGGVLTITEDTLSGITGWSPLMLGVMGVLGLFALWTSYLPISLEIKNSLERDLGWSPFLVFSILAGVPILTALFGIKDFVSVLGLAGGIFLAVQYVLIILVSSKVLVLRRWEKFLASLVVLVFLLAAIYEIYYFVIR
jgi:tyrosine-specific transport protein